MAEASEAETHDVCRVEAETSAAAHQAQTSEAETHAAAAVRYAAAAAARRRAMDVWMWDASTRRWHA